MLSTLPISTACIVRCHRKITHSKTPPKKIPALFLLQLHCGAPPLHPAKDSSLESFDFFSLALTLFTLHAQPGNKIAYPPDRQFEGNPSTKQRIFFLFEQVRESARRNQYATYKYFSKRFEEKNGQTIRSLPSPYKQLTKIFHSIVEGGVLLIVYPRRRQGYAGRGGTIGNCVDSASKLTVPM